MIALWTLSDVLCDICYVFDPELLHARRINTMTTTAQALRINVLLLLYFERWANSLAMMAARKNASPRRLLPPGLPTGTSC